MLKNFLLKMIISHLNVALFELNKMLEGERYNQYVFDSTLLELQQKHIDYLLDPNNNCPDQDVIISILLRKFEEEDLRS
jgi:hypothetical protein